MASAAIASPVVVPYSHDHFQSLPMLKDARNRFLEVNGDAIVADNIKSLFVSEGMDRIFGLAMIHRHFDLKPNQKLVEYNGTSTPWDSSQTTVGMRNPQPHMWAFDKDGLLKPIEFRYAEKQDEPWTEKELAFAAKFKATLDTLNLSHLFGLARYPGDDFAGSCEITEGTANINLKPEDVSGHLLPAATES